MLRRIVVGYDFSENSDDALAWVAEVARATNAHVSVVHIIDATSEADPAVATARRDLIAHYVYLYEEAGETPADRFLANAEASFTDLERLVLRFTDKIARNVKGTKATLAALQQHLGAGEIVELIMAIGFWGMVARVLETTEVELEEFAGKVNLLDRSQK